MTECPCVAIKKLWNKKDKTNDELKSLILLIPEQFTFSSYYEDGVKKYKYLCKDCGVITP